MIFKDTSAPVLSKQKVLLKVSKTWVILAPQLLVDLFMVRNSLPVHICMAKVFIVSES